MTTGIRSATRQSRHAAKAAFRSGCALAALLGSIGIVAPAHAQMAGANGMVVENQPQMRVPNMMVAENIPQNAPVMMIAENIPHAAPGTMIVENAAQTSPQGFSPVNTPYATPATASGQGTPVFSSGSGTVVQSALLDTITVNTAEAIIDWTLFDTAIGGGDISFLPDGRTIFFTGPNDHTVLNRIIPVDQSRAIRFDGRVLSNDNVWFYSPGGIVIGATGQFDVGSLILTTNEIDVSGGLFGPGGEIRFRGAAGSSSSIIIEERNNATAAIDATNNGSYVALVAPRVEVNGLVDVNGSVAYVAAEQADITINTGLFDIAVSVGTTDPNGIVHGETGQTTGAASNPTPAMDGENPGDPDIPANPDAQAIYMVAIPKNDAITMLINGSVGYDPAVSADVANGQIILSAGYNVSVSGAPDNPVAVIDANPVTAFAGSIDFLTPEFDSNLMVQASGFIDATNEGAGGIVSDSDLTLVSGTGIDFGGTLGSSVDIGGDVTLRAPTVNVMVDRNTLDSDAFGRIVIGGSFTVDASVIGAIDLTPGSDGEDVTGGSITLDISDGGLLSAGSINLLANATAGLGINSAGTAAGGTVDISISGASSAIDTGIMLASAAARDATSSSNLLPQLGGDSVGGTITLNISDGSLTAAQLALDTSATATSGDSTTEISNDATAGTISANFTGGTHDIGFLTLQTFATMATSFDAAGNDRNGLANGGTASLLVDGATLDIANSLRINADTDGQTSLAMASSTNLTVRNGGELGIGNSLDMSTFASGGNVGVENQAGTINILADDASLTFNSLFLDASNFLGGFGGSSPADAAAGGTVTISSYNGAQIIGDGFSSIGTGANATNANDGSTARGGTILFDANGGTIQMGGSSFVDASGVGNSNSDPTDLINRGLGTGGTITYRVRNAGTMSFGDVNADSDGSVRFDVEGGGSEPVGEGGVGIGGQVIFDLIDGTFSAIDLNIGAEGSGGPGGGEATGTSNLDPIKSRELDYSSRPAWFGALGNTPFALPVDPGANGGDGIGGTVSFNLNGGNATVTNLTISANGIGGAGGFGDGDLGIGAGGGGDGIGGAATFNAIAGTLTITNTLIVASNGTGGDGGFGDGADAGSGGDGFGGTATFDLDGSSTIGAGTVLVSTDGFGGDGGSTSQSFGGLDGGPGGNGGNGTGGDAVFNNTSGTLSFGTLASQSIGTGGDGGGSFGVSIGEAVDDGGSGGDGTGGTATINLNQDDLTFPVYTVEANGVGGSGGSGLNGGGGGNAFGGTAALNVNDAEVQLDDPTIRAIATGGNGGSSDGISGAGGNGGSATGGAARIEVNGLNGSIPISFIILESDGTGGDAGNGGRTDFGVGGTAGNGGSGGNGSGGSSELVARTGGTMTIANAGFVVSSIGLGGTGGAGGDIDMIGGGIAGDGGDGGIGTGGSPTLLAQGGTITASDIALSGAGTGGDGGTGGTDLVVQIGADGNGGNGVGGNPVIEIQDGSPGIVSLGATSMLADGAGGAGTVAGSSFAGRIEIIDTSTDPAGLITMDSLTAQALTDTSGATSGFFLTADSGAIAIAGDVDITVGGNAEFAFDDDGQMTVGGNMTVTSSASILLSHTNNSAPTNSLDILGTFTAAALGDFNAMAGSRIASGDVTDIRAEGNAFAADLTAFGRIDLSAGQDAVLGNGTMTGGPLTVIRIDAGSDGDPTNPLYDPQYNATITGTVSSAGNVRIFAGGNAIFQGGSVTGADNRIEVQTGDDIIVESGATVSAGLNPSVAPNPLTPFSDQAIVNLNAGGLALSLISPILTPISSIIVAGTLEATNTAVVLNADGIDGLGGTITASSISADINNAPSNAVIAAIGQSDDNGLLSANCLEGNVCLGTIGADNRIEIGQSGVPITVVIEGGTVTADTILISTRSDMVIGTDGVASTFDASSEILIESTEGNIELRDASVSSDLVQISAASGSLLGTGSLTSSNDVGITVAQDIFADAIIAGGQLTTIADIGSGLQNLYTVAGSIDVGTYVQGADVNFRIEAGGDISFDSVTMPNRQFRLFAGQTGPGDVFLGTTTGTTLVELNGDNVGFTDLTASTGTITILATSGDVTGGSASAATTLDIEAVGGSLFGGDFAGDGINLDATGDIDFSTASAGGTLNATAGGNFNFAQIDADGTNITATGINGGDIQVSGIAGGSPNTLRLTASGDIDLGDISSVDAVVVNADGTFRSGSADAGSTNTITAASISTGNASAGSALTFSASAGGISSGDLTAGAAMNLDATGDIDFGTASAGGTLSATAGGNFTFLQINADGTNISAVDINGGGIQVSGIAGGSPNTLRLTASGDIDLGDISSVDAVVVNADGTFSSGSADAGSTNTITAAAIAIGDASAGSTLTFNAIAGDLTTGNLVAGGIVNLDATGSIGAGDMSSSSSVFADAGGDLDFANASGQTVVMNAGGTMDFDTIAGEAITLTAGDAITGTSATTSATALSNNIVLVSGSSITVDTLDAAENVSLSAAGNIASTTILAGGMITADANGSVSLGSADAGTDLLVDATDIDFASLVSGGGMSVTANGGDIIGGDVDGGSGVSLSATGDIALDSASTGGDADITAANALSADQVDVSGMATLVAGTDITLGTVTAGTGISANAGGALAIDNADTAGDIDLLADSITAGSLLANGAIAFTSTNATTITDAQADLAVTIDASSIAFGTIAGESVTLTATDAITGTTLTTGDTASDNDVSIVSGASVTVDSIDAGDAVSIMADGAIGVTTLSGGFVDLTSGAVLTVDMVDALRLDATASVLNLGDITLTSNSLATSGSATLTATAGAITFDILDAAEDVTLSATGDIGFATVTAGGTVTADSGGSMAFTDITGEAIDLTASVMISGTSLTTPTDTAIDNDIVLDAGGIIDVTTVAASGDVDLTAGGTLAVDMLSGQFLTVTATQAISLVTVAGLALDATGSSIEINEAVITSNVLAASGEVELNATSGNVLFGSITADDSITIDSAADVRGSVLDAGGAIAVTAAGDIRPFTMTGQDIALTADGMIDGSGVSGANITLDAGSSIDFGSVSASGDVDIIAGADINVTGLSGQFLSVETADALALGIVRGLRLEATGSSVDIEDILVTSDARAASGAIIVNATNGAATVIDLGASGDTVITGDTVALRGQIAVDGDLTLTARAGDITTGFGFGEVGGSINYQATGDIDYIRSHALADITMASGGAISGVEVIAGGDVLLEATNGIGAELLWVDGDATLRSANGAVVVNSDIAVTGDLIASGAAILLNAANDLSASDVRATNGDIDIVTGGALTVAQAQSVGDINLTSTGSSVTAGNLQAGLASVTPASFGPIASPFGSVVGSPGPGDITISGATDVVIVDDTIATNGLFISANGLIDIQALATGANIETYSADFDIGSVGQLGTSSLTQTILIANDGSTAMVIGGSGTAGSFSLDGDEFTRITSGGDITVSATDIGTGAPSLLIERLIIRAGTNDTIGSSGTFNLLSEGSIRIDDNVSLYDASSSNTLFIQSGEEIRLNAETGNIEVLNDGFLSGAIVLVAPSIIAATDSAYADIAGATVEDIDARLADSDGLNFDGGFFQADTLSFTVDESLYVQNSVSGTDFADRRGFVVGEGGISIASSSNTPIGIVINGVREDDLGNRTTGIDLIAQTTVPAAFAANSTINGCLIASPASCSVVTPPPPPPPPPDTPEIPDDPVQDLLEEEIEEKPVVEQPTTPLIETVEIFSNREGPLIDDPVTGSGNDDLWIRNPVGGGNDD